MEGTSKSGFQRTTKPHDCSPAAAGLPVESGDVNLRQWLDNPDRKVDALDCLHIFSQVVDIASKLANSQCIRPSFFVVSFCNRVLLIKPASCSGSGELKGSSLGIVGSQENSSSVKEMLLMESYWYTPPEEVSGAAPSSCSVVYQLGVLIFELFCEFGSLEEKSSTMANLRHRVLPQELLLKWPKEASFCMWLLHPDPSSRPKMGELLQSEFLSEPRLAVKEKEAAVELHERLDEHDLLVDFLLTLEQRKQGAVHSLNETMSFIASDIEDARKLQVALRLKGLSNPELTNYRPLVNPTDLTVNSDDDDESGFSGSRKRNRLNLNLKPDEHEKSEIPTGVDQESASSKSSRLTKNFQKVESAYFLARRRKKGTTKESDNSENNESGWINSFLEGLCKYLAFSKLKVKANLRQGDLLNSANLVCSLSFDRDGEFFATAGVNKKIKVFEYNAIMNKIQDIHYPVVELCSESRISCICWNKYIKSQIASSNFEGVVQVWDVTRGKALIEMREHERRIWSIDYSASHPSLLASASDDGSVKLWNTNQGSSVGTIKTKANVCCVQFPMDSSRTIAFGSADHRIYYYDLRNLKVPLCTLVGHDKTVSYVKFVDSTTLVSASPDNTIKLWDLAMSTSRVLDWPLQSFTGHLNLKKFVGLSVSGGYIATGSETNEVFVYHKDFPMPALSFEFNSMDSFSGDEVDDPGQFISSICWRGQSSTLVAANSMGNIKVLEMA